MDKTGKKTFLASIGDVGGTTGYAEVSASDDASIAAQEAQKYLNDSLLINKLTDCVYELLQEDLRYQRERVNNYGSGRWL